MNRRIWFYVLSVALAPVICSCKKETTVVDEACEGTVFIRSEPSGAEVYVDGEFYGSAPAKLKLNAGLRKIEVKMEGYPDWVREVKITCGAIINLPVKWQRPQ